MSNNLISYCTFLELELLSMPFLAKFRFVELNLHILPRKHLPLKINPRKTRQNDALKNKLGKNLSQ